MLIRAGRKSREDTGSNIGAGGGGVVDMATGGTVDMATRGWLGRVVVAAGQTRVLWTGGIWDTQRAAPIV